MFGKSETGGIFTRSIELIYKLPWQQRKRLRCIDWLSETLPRIFFPGVVFSLFYVFSVAISSRYPAPVFLLLPLCRPECHRWFRGPACSVLVAPWECLLMPALCLRFQLIWWFRGLASFFPCCLSGAVLAPDAGVPLMFVLCLLFLFSSSQLLLTLCVLELCCFFLVVKWQNTCRCSLKKSLLFFYILYRSSLW
jgi:hypothetical protein